MYMEDMAVHWCLQSTSAITAEEGEQNKSGNYTSLVLTGNIWANGDSRVDCDSKWILEGFSYPWDGKIDSISELSKPLEWKPQSKPYTWDSGMTPDGWPFPIPWYWGGSEAGCVFSPNFSSFPRSRRKEEKM